MIERNIVAGFPSSAHSRQTKRQAPARMRRSHPRIWRMRSAAMRSTRWASTLA